ncbi:MAG: dihydroorotase [Pseudomonadales bacterium]
MTQSLTITRPDDWHIHLRDGDTLAATVRDASRYFGRAIIMPNLVPPVRNAEQAQDYRRRILAERAPGSVFEPLMVLYLTDQTSADDIQAAAKPGSGCVAAKLYPAGATTNSESGVTQIEALDGVFQAMQECGMPLLVHGEVTHAEIDVFDREAQFIDDVLKPLLQRHPGLKVVLEHISTMQAVEFVRQAPDNIAATITAHHLLYNRNHLLAGNVRPHYYCLPILKRASHQKALLGAAISGNPKFFLGTDSAPHPVSSKEAACGCAGCYTAHAALELYAEVFEQQQALDKLEAFASFFGPDFYGLPRNTDTITLVKNAWQVPEQMEFGSQTLRPLKYGEQIAWQVAS